MCGVETNGWTFGYGTGQFGDWRSLGLGLTGHSHSGHCAVHTYGFLIAAAVDQRALGAVRFVLDCFGVQAEADEEARILEPAVPLRIAAGGRIYLFKPRAHYG